MHSNPNPTTTAPAEPDTTPDLTAAADLLARLGVDKTGQQRDPWRCLCGHEAEHLLDGGCVAPVEGGRCGCTLTPGGESK